MITYHPSICLFTPLNNFSSETPGPNFFKLLVEPSFKGSVGGGGGGGLKICTDCHIRLVKMATMSINCKNTKNFLNQESFEAKSWYIASGTQHQPSLFR